MITLRLTPDEAKTLHTILFNIGGSPTSSARKDADSIYDKLAKHNGKFLFIKPTFDQNCRGSISFNS